jgi:NitT/TauT family transport system substrate-binding protein
MIAARRILVLATAATLMTVAPMAAQGAYDKTNGPTAARVTTADRITLATRPISDSIPAHLCVSRGICAKYGIDLNVQHFTGTSADIAAALQAGSIDVAYVGTTNVFQARQAGFDQLIIAAAAGESKKNPSGDANALLFKDPSIRTGKDLEGKTVGVNGLQSASHAIVATWVIKGGGDPRKVDFVNLADPQKPAAIAAGRIDAGHVAEPYRTVGLDMGQRAINMALQIRPQGLWIGAYAAKSSSLNARPRAYRNLVRALQESSELANRNRTLAKDTLKSYSTLDKDLIDKSNLPLFGARVSFGNAVFWKNAININFGANVTVTPEAAIWSGVLLDPPPVLRFVRPKNGSVTPKHVTFRVSAQNIKLVASEIGKANVASHGYLQFAMDGGKFDTPRYSGPNGRLAATMRVAGKYSPSAVRYITYRNLPRGKHRLVARLANNDGTPIGPVAKLTFTVK